VVVGKMSVPVCPVTIGLFDYLNQTR